MIFFNDILIIIIDIIYREVSQAIICKAGAVWLASVACISDDKKNKTDLLTRFKFMLLKLSSIFVVT
jgi:hypothetical protein